MLYLTSAAMRRVLCIICTTSADLAWLLGRQAALTRRNHILHFVWLSMRAAAYPQHLSLLESASIIYSLLPKVCCTAGGQRAIVRAV
jgi:hypothetical protein